MELLEIYNDDCFNIFPKIKDKSIDLFILDLPYGQTACAWDTCIDLERMWIEIKRMMKPSAIICFFCTTKFGYTLIKSNEKWFKYDLIWKKSRKVGFLSANKRQLRNHENIYVFNDNNETQFPKNGEYGTYNPQKTEGHKPYTEKKGKKKGLDGGVYSKHIGEYGDSKIHGDLLSQGKEKVTDRHPTSIIEHENVYVFKKEQGTYNPQKTKREKDYKHSGQRSSNTLYNGDLIDCNTLFKKEDGLHPTSIMDYGQHTQPEKDCGMIKGGYYRGEGAKPFKRMPNDPTTSHPTSIIENTILEYKSVQRTLHRTEKPVGLLEYLIKTYSNEGEIVMDFTMGSASTGEACFNTKRKFIGVEMDDDIFVLAQERLANLLERN